MYSRKPGLAAIRLENYTLAITMICFVSMQFFLVGLFCLFMDLISSYVFLISDIF